MLIQYSLIYCAVSAFVISIPFDSFIRLMLLVLALSGIRLFICFQNFWGSSLCVSRLSLTNVDLAFLMAVLV